MFAEFTCSSSASETRRTYRAVFSEPKVIVPSANIEVVKAQPAGAKPEPEHPEPMPTEESAETTPPSAAGANGKKRALDQGLQGGPETAGQSKKDNIGDGGARKKKKKNRQSQG